LAFANFAHFLDQPLARDIAPHMRAIWFDNMQQCNRRLVFPGKRCRVP
jgi:hypothetical protein